MGGNQFVESNGGTGSSFQFEGFALRDNIEGLAELFQFVVQFLVGDGIALIL